ncbi:MAG: M20/M25/M40 family metallo-hydrolase [Deltaproteobacteria bacterium]|nr:M20/M25/M40 family metallo-hydrolase [Deltaproteobacteria bacterium]
MSPHKPAGTVALALLATTLMACSGPGGAFSRFGHKEHAAAAVPSAAAFEGAGVLGPARQLTFAGKRSGEGYLSQSGDRMVFQSEREPGNPFYQIYSMDLQTGALRRLSTGVGKSTCAWIHPSGRRALFASTHLDPEAPAKQAQELADRAEGLEQRYAWDYDELYDLFSVPLDASDESAPLRLTHARGYDAEASWSPNGREIVFASNRHAFAADAGIDTEQLARDPSFFIDLYVMDAGGRNVRRLTETEGYDGGPFFSPDGQHIVWRRFKADGESAEIHTMRSDGTGERKLTRLGAMSWAPFYHPSGDYLIFTTNLHGFADFELYIVDAEGRHTPVRVSDSRGFDGLPVFGPGGDELFWTSNRRANGRSQIFRAQWNDALARRLLGLPHGSTPAAAPLLPLPERTDPSIQEADLRAHVEALADDLTEGRLTGTPGERIATSYVARAFRRLGLIPEGDGTTYFQSFGFTAGVALGADNALHIESSSGSERVAPVVDVDWRPFAFSREGEIEASEVVYAGYGIVAPAGPDGPAIDAYADLDVTDRWVLVFRYVPEGLDAESRQHLHRYSSLRYKAMMARDRGARGLLVMSGPNSRVREELAPLRFDASLAGTSIAAASITDAVAERLTFGTGESLSALHDRADALPTSEGRLLPGVRVAARVDLDQERAHGRNVIGRLQVGPEPSDDVVMIGAHVDHLGRGEGSSSLAGRDEIGRIHPGADDNASGVAALLEAAEALAARQARGEFGARRDVVFAAWSGEELGLLGSSWWVEHATNPHDEDAKLRDHVIAYLNMDMVGRLNGSVSIFGVSSSSSWRPMLERQAVRSPLSISAQEDAYLPTDATRFYMSGVPILSVFTGAHAEYHTPRDTPDTLDFQGLLDIAILVERIAADLAQREMTPDFVAVPGPSSSTGPSLIRVYLGTIPDYAQTDLRGVRLSGVAPKGPAERGGMRAGDIVVEVAGRPIENIYDYTYSLDALKVGVAIQIGVLREGERIELEVVPASRD